MKSWGIANVLWINIRTYWITLWIKSTTQRPVVMLGFKVFLDFRTPTKSSDNHVGKHLKNGIEVEIAIWYGMRGYVDKIEWNVWNYAENRIIGIIKKGTVGK